MKKFSLFLMTLLLSLGLFAQDAQHLAYFSFNSLAEGTPVPTVISADEGAVTSAALYMDGTNGSTAWPSSALGNFSGSTINALTGYPKGRDLALQSNASNQQSIVFKLSTTGYEGLVLTYAFKRTAQGHTSCLWSYSTDGTNFTDLPVPSDQPYGTGQGTAIDYRLETVDMSGIAVLNDQNEVYLKLYVDGCDGESSRIRLDNVQFNAYPSGPDVYAPVIRSAVARGESTVVLTFNELLDNASATNNANYSFDSIYTVTAASLNANVVTLTSTPAFTPGVPFTLYVQNVADVAGNVMEPDTFTMRYSVADEFVCANIAELRSKLSCEDYSAHVVDSTNEYKITGSVIVTASDSYKNQKIIQDETGAILIYDNNDKLFGTQDSLAKGDKISGIYGTLTNYYGFLELVPTREYEQLEGYMEEVEPRVVTLEDLNDNNFMIQHQAEMITLENVTITSSGVFAIKKRYDLQQGSTTAPALFPYFRDADFISQPIPTGISQNITGFNFATTTVNGSNSGEGSGLPFRYYIVPRFKEDMTGMTLVPDYGKMKISVYPNPTTSFVTVTDVDATEVEIYDLNGKKVASQSMRNTHVVSMQNLSAGSYFLRLLKDDELVGTAKVVKR
ncbi:MAG: T9SS type A sorting domain-containing protein [Bacteroidales bacterium]|nr:T9SS type A sorting domain-containing protein [Bacteroidales bacterium]